MRAISRKGSDRASGCVIRVVGLIFLLVGGGLFVLMSGRPILNWATAQTWQAVPCTILSSEVAVNSSSDGDTYSVDIRYAYVWEGQHYEGSRYNFFHGSSSGTERKQAAVDRYPAGETRECFIDPDNPTNSVLSRDFTVAYLMGCFGLIFVLFGVLMFFMRTGEAVPATGVPSIFRGENAPRNYRYSLSSASGALPDAVPDHGTVTLKGGHNSIAGFIGLSIFAVIWNGAISFGVLDAAGVGEGSFDIFTFLFMIPFMLVGLAVFGGALYFFLTMFNPRTDLTMRPGYLPLGGAVVVAWNFCGNTARIQKLTITVRGQEAATYRRGTSTSTDRSVFEKIVAIETTEPADIAAGEATFTMPEFTAPSFNGPNNKITWQVKVHGEIHRWPDVNEEFELVVHPLPLPEGSTHQPAEFHLSGSGENP